MGNIIEWNRDTREIIETSGVSEVVVGYADSQEDADQQISEFRSREDTNSYPLPLLSPRIKYGVRAAIRG